MSTANPSDHELQKYFARAANEGPYTNIAMLKYLVSIQAGRSFDDLVHDWKGVRQRLTVGGIEQHDLDDELRPLWAQKTGTCTAFALKIMKLANGEFPDRYEWILYRFGPHHLARCRRSGTVIDSSSHVGIDVLPEREWKRFTDNYLWYSDGISKSRRNGKEQESTGMISRKDAMTYSLLNVIDKRKGPKPLCYFREFTNGQMKYWGLLKWDFTNKKLILIPDTTTEEKTEVQIRFGTDGSDSDLQSCIETVGRFIVAYGGPRGLQQWEADGLFEIHKILFEAATKSWGKPTLVDV